MSGAKHTPGPWQAWVDDATYGVTGPSAATALCAKSAMDADVICGPCYSEIAAANAQVPAIAIGDTKKQAENNARRIVQCVNAHDELVEALRELLESHEAPYPPAEEGQAAQTAWVMRQAKACDIARAALSKAEGAGNTSDGEGQKQ